MKKNWKSMDSFLKERERLMANEVFNDRRVCDKCDKVFLLADETTENIEGQCNPEIHEETYEGIYCWECINSIEEKELG